MTEKTIYHICKRVDWVKAQELGEYGAESLSSEGFIHFSTRSQVIDTANRYYKNETGLILLCVEVDKITVELKYERSGEGVFPHVYGPVEIDAVEEILQFEEDEDGNYVGPII